MKEIVSGLIRHGLTSVGGGLVSSGLLSTDKVSTLVGIIVTLLGIVWSVVEKKMESKYPTLQPVLDLVSKALDATPAQSSVKPPEQKQ